MTRKVRGRRWFGNKIGNGRRRTASSAFQIRIVVRQVCNASLEGRRDPIAEFRHKAGIVVDPRSAPSRERCELCWSYICGFAAVPKALADEHTSVSSVLPLQSLVEMKPISMLSPSSIVLVRARSTCKRPLTNLPKARPILLSSVAQSMPMICTLIFGCTDSTGYSPIHRSFKKNRSVAAT